MKFLDAIKMYEAHPSVLRIKENVVVTKDNRKRRIGNSIQMYLRTRVGVKTRSRDKFWCNKYDGSNLFE